MIAKFINLLFLLTFITGLSAQSGEDVINQGPRTTGGAIAVGIVLMLCGLIYTFAGKKIIKIVIALHGFIFFGLLTVIIASKIVTFDKISQGQAIGIVIGAVIVGILGALLSWCLYKVGIFLLGALVGGLLGNLIVQLFNNPPLWLHITLTAVFAIVFGALCLFFLKFMIIVTTSWSGANLFMNGVDSIANKGFTDITNSLVDGKNIYWNGALIAMVVSTFLIALLGALVQYKAFGTSETGLEEKRNGDYNAVNNNYSPHQ